MSLAQSRAETYKAKCQMCHAADGSGDTPAGKTMKARPFNSPDVLKESDADLIAIIKKGKDKMPAFVGQAYGCANHRSSWRYHPHIAK